jgi:hypothetical protein
MFTQREAYLRYKSQDRFPARNAGKCLGWMLYGLPATVTCSGCPMVQISHIIKYEDAETGFLQFFKSKFLFDLKIKYQRFNVKGRPMAYNTFKP